MSAKSWPHKWEQDMADLAADVQAGDGEWVTEFASPSGEVEVENLGGVAWHDAPKPRRLHKCKAQTRGWTGYFTRVLRCACGSISFDGRHWSERNSR